MKTFYYFLISLICFYLDTLLTFLSPIRIGNFDIISVPHLTLLFILVIAIFKNTNIALILSVFLGIIHDVYFGQIYGVYLFGNLIFTLIVDKFIKVFYRDQKMIFISLLVLTALFEVFVSLVYGVLGLVELHVIQLIFLRIMPTVIFNALLITIIYTVISIYKNRKHTVDSK
ncbi:rod shape-determining protein MreD [Staphylococcus canis]|uniref:Rod shape-determining protein MreD n=1 Tax=Staphylococcus canis TaxID=2724942 RepID=A0ABS0T687_9STAP|nr:rod shape-determining protein MreD [Staphylococcus canis]MBI5974187.1 rod shape-determining protein MreD [Staphylococcus canis]